jgi:CPA1 family monovalent cation:H+ antiporter
LNIETAFILLFVVATAVAIAARRMHLPYTVALVLAGLVLGALQLFPAPHLTKTLLFSVFLPGLLFEAAFHVDFRALRGSLITITSLAVPGVVASTALIAIVLTPVADALGLAQAFTWKHALVFGALISATDPVAVVGLFRDMGAPRRLTMLLDGESLLNDGTAIVFFALSLSLLEGTDVTAGSLSTQFLSIVGVGALIGTVIGSAASLLTRQVDDPMIEITLTTIAAYGSFVTAETLHASGVIATVAAGLLCGNFGARTGMSASTRIAAETFWEYVAFALNSIVFLLIGLEISLPMLLAAWLPIVVAYLVVTLSRASVVAASRALVGPTSERFPWRWTVVLTWGGLRGALPMVLALSLPTSFAHRELILSMTFGVVVLSMLVHGLTMSTLLRRLGLVIEPVDRTAYEVSSGRLQAAAAALQELERMSQMRIAAPGTFDALREEYRQLIGSTEKDLQKLAAARRQLRDQDLHRVRRRLLAIERDRVMQAFQEGVLGHDSHAKLLADIDARLLQTEGDIDASGPEGDDPGDAR